MPNFSPTNYESPETEVSLNWGTVPKTWDKEVAEMYKAMKDNEFSKFFYQSDVAQLRALCTFHTRSIHDPDTSAATWNVIWQQWDKFGTNLKSRANLRYTLAKTQAAEDYTSDVHRMEEEAFDGDSN